MWSERTYLLAAAMRDIHTTDLRESFVEPMQHLDAEVGREEQREQQKGDEQKHGPAPRLLLLDTNDEEPEKTSDNQPLNHDVDHYKPPNTRDASDLSI